MPESLTDLLREIEETKLGMQQAGTFTPQAENEYVRLLRQIEVRKQSDAARMTDYRGTAPGAFGASPYSSTTGRAAYAGLGALSGAASGLGGMARTFEDALTQPSGFDDVDLLLKGAAKLGLTRPDDPHRVSTMLRDAAGYLDPGGAYRFDAAHPIREIQARGLGPAAGDFALSVMPQAVSSMALIGGSGGRVALGARGAAMESGVLGQEAEAAGASPEQVRQMQLLGIPLGASEVFGMDPTAAATPIIKQGVRAYAREIAGEAARESAQEFGQTMGEGYAKKGVYRPDLPHSGILGESATSSVAGAALGTGMSSVRVAAADAHQDKARAQEADELKKTHLAMLSGIQDPAGLDDPMLGQMGVGPEAIESRRAEMMAAQQREQMAAQQAEQQRLEADNAMADNELSAMMTGARAGDPQATAELMEQALDASRVVSDPSVSPAEKVRAQQFLDQRLFPDKKNVTVSSMLAKYRLDQGVGEPPKDAASFKKWVEGKRRREEAALRPVVTAPAPVETPVMSPPMFSSSVTTEVTPELEEQILPPLLDEQAMEITPPSEDDITEMARELDPGATSPIGLGQEIDPNATVPPDEVAAQPMQDEPAGEGEFLFRDDKGELRATKVSLQDIEQMEADIEKATGGAVKLRLRGSIWARGDSEASKKALAAHGRKGPTELAGQALPGVIEVSLAQDGAKALHTNRHEIGHVLLDSLEPSLQAKVIEDVGMLTPKTRTLDKAGRRSELEEVFCDQLADWWAGAPAKTPALQRAFEAIRRMFDTLGDYLRSRGFQSAGDVFGTAEGAAGRRLKKVFGDMRDGRIVAGSGPSDAKAAIRRGPVPGFFSGLGRLVGQKMPARATPEQVRSIISGAKKEEVEWSGLNEWLAEQKGPVTKEQVQQFLAENDVQLQEVELSDNEMSLEDKNDYFEKVEELRHLRDHGSQISDHEFRRRLDALRAEYGVTSIGNGGEPFGSKDTKYGSQPNLLTPGGKNQRELLLTLPQKNARSAKVEWTKEKQQELFELSHRVRVGVATTAEKAREMELLDERRAFTNAAREASESTFRAGHYDEPNVLAHVRFNDRTGPNGEKILHVEEIQSDWHQKGRKEGYQSDRASGPLPDNIKISPEEVYVGVEQRPVIRYFVTDRGEVRGTGHATAASAEEFARGLAAKRGTVPDAPFKTSWHELAFKRMLRYAAENGYDTLTWTTGEQQAERYDLSKQIDALTYRKDGDDWLIAADKDGEEVISDRRVSDSKLEDNVGKEVASKMRANEGAHPGRGADEDTRELRGVDLKVGGEGMKGFYDKILVDFAKKYVKKWGATVGQTRLPGDGHVNGYALIATGQNSDGEQKWGVAPFVHDEEGALDYGSAVAESTNRDEMLSLEERLNKEWQGTSGPAAHSVTVTPQMRDSVLGEGQPKYQVINHGEQGQKKLRNVKFEPDGSRVTYEYWSETDKAWKPESRTPASFGKATGPAPASASPLAPPAGSPLRPGTTKASPGPAKPPAAPPANTPPGQPPAHPGTPPSLPAPPPGQPPGSPLFNMHGESVIEDGIRVSQDRFVHLKRTEEDIRKSGKAIPEDQDAYVLQELADNKMAADVRHFTKDEVDPLVAEMKKLKIQPKELDEYMTALFAPERNAYIASINPAMPDGGSGLTNQEAAKILADFQAAGKTASLDQASKLVRKIIKGTQDLVRSAGLEEGHTVDAWQESDLYVPLRGFADQKKQVKLDHAGKGHGRGLAVAGKFAKQALGRGSRSASPLANIVADRQRAIRLARKSEVVRALAELVQANPNPDEWDVFWPGHPDKERRLQVIYIDPTTGNTSKTKKPGWLKRQYVNNNAAMHMGFGPSAEDYLPFKAKNGEQAYLAIKNEKLREALKNIGPMDLGKLLSVLHGTTGFISAMATRWNVEFPLVNLVRDATLAGSTVAAEQSKGGKLEGRKISAPKVMAQAVTSIRTVWKGLRGTLTGPDAILWSEFEKNGGMTDFLHPKTVQQIQADIQQLVDLANGGPAIGVKKTYLAAKRAVEFINSTIENGTRFSVYKNARKAGLSEQAAASLAVNATLNFHRRGEIGPILSALYVFANPNIQGTAALARIANTNRGKVLLGALLGFGSLLPLFNAGISDDDEDGRSFYSKISDTDKERHVIIMMPNGKSFLKIPAPYGLSIPFYAGQLATETAMGERSPVDAAIELALSTMASFSPMGVSRGQEHWQTLLKSAAPTIPRMGAELLANQNFAGAPIYKTNRNGTPKPDSQMSFRSTPSWAVAVAKLMNKASGGNESEPGKVDVSPGTLHYMANYWLNGVYRLATNAIGTAKAAADPKVERPLTQVPLVRRFVGEPQPFVDSNTYYDRKKRIEQKRAHVKTLDDAGVEKWHEGNKGWATASKELKASEKELRELRSKIKKIEDKTPGTIDEILANEKLIEELDAKIESEYKRFNKAFDASVGRTK